MSDSGWQRTVASATRDYGRLPGTWLAMCVVVQLPPTTTAAAQLLDGGGASLRLAAQSLGWRAWDVVIGAVGFAGVIGAMLYAAYVLGPTSGRLGAVLVQRRRRVECVAAAAGGSPVELPRWAAWAGGLAVRRHDVRWLERVWRDRGRRGFVARFGALFEGYREGRHAWLLSEIALSEVVSVWSSGVLGVPCGAVNWVTFGVLGAWAVVHVIATPCGERLDHVTAVGTAAITAGIALCVALDAPDAVVAGLTYAGSAVGLVLAILPMAAGMRIDTVLRANGVDYEPSSRLLLPRILRHVLGRPRTALPRPLSAFDRSEDAVARLLTDGSASVNESLRLLVEAACQAAE